MELFSNLFRSLRALYILFILVFGVGGAYLSIASDGPDSDALLANAEAAEPHERLREPSGSVAREWERDRREDEREEAYRAAYGY